VGLVAAGLGDDGAAELPEQLGDGDGDQFEETGAGVEGALAGGGDGEERGSEEADRGPAVPGGPGGDLPGVQSGDLLRDLAIFLDFHLAMAGRAASCLRGSGCIGGFAI
jgi:hypothetical protein